MNDYTVLGKADLWTTAFVGEGQLGGVTVSGSRPDGTVVLTPQVLQHTPNGDFEQKLGVALDFENAILSFVGEFARATQLTDHASMTVELFQKLTTPKPGQEQKRFFEKNFTKTADFGGSDTVTIRLEVVII